MPEDLRTHIQATIAHLSSRRVALTVQMQEIDAMMDGLIREEKLLPNQPQDKPGDTSSGIFANMSMRWAVFFYLAEHSLGPSSVGEIAASLKAGGVSTKGVSFNSNVSAVLSQMAGKGELAKSAEGFAMTEQGKSIWQSIKKSTKFIDRESNITDATEEQ